MRLSQAEDKKTCLPYQAELDADDAEKMMRLIDHLEDLDDVQAVYSNADISDEIMEGLD